MTSEHLIIKSRTMAAELQKTRPGAARKLRRLAERLETLRFEQRRLRRAVVEKRETIA